MRTSLLTAQKNCALLLLLCPLLISCGSTSDYEVVTTKAESKTFSNKKNPNQVNSSFRIAYKLDSNGNKVFKRLTKTVTVIGSQRETLKSLKEEAKKQIVIEATEEVNGVVIQSSSESNTVNASTDKGQYSRQDFTEKAVSETAGIAQIKDLSCNILPSGSDTIKLKCTGKVSVPLMVNIQITK